MHDQIDHVATVRVQQSTKIARNALPRLRRTSDRRGRVRADQGDRTQHPLGQNSLNVWNHRRRAQLVTDLKRHRMRAKLIQHRTHRR